MAVYTGGVSLGAGRFQEALSHSKVCELPSVRLELTFQEDRQHWPRSQYVGALVRAL